MALLLATTTLINYFFTWDLANAKNPGQRKFFLIFLIVVNLGILLLFKTFGLFSHGIESLLSTPIQSKIPSTKDLLMPLALGFFTLQGLGYVLDVYSKKIKAETQFFNFALFMSFFPQLLAGPVERYKDLASQLKEENKFDIENIIFGVKTFVFALFLKFVLADNLAFFISPVLENPGEYSTSSLWGAVALYSIRIYTDFYAYMMFATGSALMFGIKLTKNFHFPYFSKSIVEFVQRWHISLYTWFRDYIYRDLVRRTSKGYVKKLTILLVFVLAALWHDIRLNFLFWGLSLFIIFFIEIKSRNLFSMITTKSGFWVIILKIKTFLLISLSWIFFFSNDLSEAFAVYKHLFYADSETVTQWHLPGFLILSIMIFIIFEILQNGRSFQKTIKDWPILAEWLLIAFFFTAFVFFGSAQQFNFIYVGF